MTIKSTPERILWKLSLRSTPETVYDLLANDGGRESFWCETSRECDGMVNLEFVNGMQTRGRVLERLRPRKFALEYFGTTVVFHLAEDGRGGTDLTLTNTEFSPADYPELLAGWLNVLLPLKALVDFGVDLRSHDPMRTWERGYVDQ